MYMVSSWVCTEGTWEITLADGCNCLCDFPQLPGSPLKDKTAYLCSQLNTIVHRCCSTRHDCWNNHLPKKSSCNSLPSHGWTQRSWTYQRIYMQIISHLPELLARKLLRQLLIGGIQQRVPQGNQDYIQALPS